MKSTPASYCSSLRLIRPIHLLAGLVPLTSFAAEIPRGFINVDRTMVIVDSTVGMNWQILHPLDAPTAELAPGSVPVGVQVEKTDTIRIDKNLKMRVHLLGASFRSNNGHGNNLDGVDSSNPGQGGGGPNGAIDLSGGIDDESKSPQANKYNLPFELWWNRNGGSWSRIFSGVQSSIVSANLKLDTTVLAGETINFGGRGYYNGGWLPFYTTGSKLQNVVVLRNGDPVPTAGSGFQYGKIKSYLGPYLTADHQKIKIGYRDLIIFMELGQSDPNHKDFNLQDLVTLVTFE